jgi:hypothetical protein
MEHSVYQLPTLADRTEYIIGLDDQPILRNLLITQCYHDLAQAQLTHLFGPTNLDWCHFATWASKTAGTFIRKDEILMRLLQIFVDMTELQNQLDQLNRRLNQLSFSPQKPLDLPKLLDKISQNISDQIMEGNLKVFSELGPLFAQMIHIFQGSQSFDQTILNQLITPLAEGPSEDGGQDNLKQALTCYYQAMFISNTRERAQMMLLANGLIGFHEQIRLQSYIAGSLHAPIEDIIDEFLQTSSIPNETLWVDPVIQEAKNNIVAEVKKGWSKFATEAMMTMKVPNEILYLGRDLPALPRKSLYPPDLSNVDLPELKTFASQFARKALWLERLKQLGRTVLVKLGLRQEAAPFSGADDWTDLIQRMNYIVTLFRSRQQEQTLMEPPFSEAQHRAILEGKIPPGPL